MAKLMTLPRLPRPARGAAIAFVLALVAAAPVAAAQPTRTVNHNLHSYVLPAGLACAFAVKYEPSGGFGTETDFSDGTVVYTVRKRGQYVNLETGASFVTVDTFREIDEFDDATNILFGVDYGEVTGWFYPGDTGPFGPVGSNGALYHFAGTATYTVDFNLNLNTGVTYTGTVTDVCAELS